jgi:hypothetical protein
MASQPLVAIQCQLLCAHPVLYVLAAATPVTEGLTCLRAGTGWMAPQTQRRGKICAGISTTYRTRQAAHRCSSSPRRLAGRCGGSGAPIEFDRSSRAPCAISGTHTDTHHARSLVNGGGLLGALAAQGINLVAASRCIILDDAWNPSINQQALFRCYRYVSQITPWFCSSV